MFKRSICVLGVSLCVLGLSLDAQATTITFDAPFTSNTPPTIEPAPFDFTRDYTTNPAINPPTTFVTQGFSFGGFGTGGTGAAPFTNSFPELYIMLDASACNSALSTPCAAGDGTDYLLAPERFALASALGAFALTSFQASHVFGPAGCPGCGDQGANILNPTSVRVRGIRAGVLVGDETFALSGAFQTFVLADPDFLNLSRVMFEALDANGNYLDGVTLFGVDNVNATLLATPVPEPASLLLFGTGLAAIAARRRRSR